MANLHRGEISATFGGQCYTLCLTLGALAELEERFGNGNGGGLAALGERLAAGKLTARDLIAIVAIGLKGAGHALSEAQVAALPLKGGLGAYADAVAALFKAAFGESEAPDPQPPQP